MAGAAHGAGDFLGGEDHEELGHGQAGDGGAARRALVDLHVRGRAHRQRRHDPHGGSDGRGHDAAAGPGGGDHPVRLGAATEVPHGGIFDLFVPGAVDKPLAWLLAIVAGTAVTTGVLFFSKRPVAEAVKVDTLVASRAVAA
jgi:hypothetical protein